LKRRRPQDDTVGENRRAEGVQSVVITLRILEALAQAKEDKGVTELANELGTTKARIHRHLQTLRERNYVFQDESTEKYQPGMRIFVLGQLVRERFSLFAAAVPEMTKLRDRLGQTVVLNTLVDNEVQVVELVRGTAPIEIALKLNSRFPCYATAQGKVHLAFSPDGLPPSLPLTRLTDRTIVSRPALEIEISKVRARGWAVAPGEMIEGINTLAAPVFSHEGRMVASIAIVGSIKYVPVSPPAEQVEAVVSAARRTSETMGWRPALPR
jgi:DNA-binding IclR family transcriptional regulator